MIGFPKDSKLMNKKGQAKEGCFYNAKFDTKQISENRIIFILLMLTIVCYITASVDRIINFIEIDVLFLFLIYSLCIIFSVAICLIVNPRFYQILFGMLILSFGVDVGYMIVIALSDKGSKNLSNILFYPFISIALALKIAIFILLILRKDKIFPLSKDEQNRDHAMKQINQPTPDKDKTQI
jgi:hypothetical protein